MDSYTVYCHTNMINGKMYVGITKFKPEKRWKDGKGYKTQIVFNRAIQKYGWNNFYHEIVASGITKKEAENFEKLLIEKFNLTDYRFGYNQSIGGNVPLMNEKIKAKLSEAEKRLWSDDTYRHMMSDAHIGNRASEETRIKMSIAHKGKFTGFENAAAIAVRCLDTDELFPSITAAANSIGVSKQGMRKAINNHKRCKGKMFIYSAS